MIGRRMCFFDWFVPIWDCRAEGGFFAGQSMKHFIDGFHNIAVMQGDFEPKIPLLFCIKNFAEKSAACCQKMPSVLLYNMEVLNKMVKKNEMFGLLMVFLGAVLWGTLSLFVKTADMDAYMFTALRYLIAALFLMPFIFRGGIPLNRDFVWFVVSYVVLGITLVFSIMYTANAIAIGMQFTAPLWVFVYNFCRGKRFAKKHLLPLGFILAGLLVFMLTPGEGVTWYGNLLALFSGILFGILTIFSARVQTDNPTGMTGVGNLVGAVAMLACYFAFGGGVSDFVDLSGVQWAQVVFVGIFQTAGGFALFNIGLKYADTQKASVISTMELVSSVVLVAVFLREYPDIFSIVGSLLIICGIVCQFFMAGRQAAEASAEIRTTVRS